MPRSPHRSYGALSKVHTWACICRVPNMAHRTSPASFHLYPPPQRGEHSYSSSKLGSCCFLHLHHPSPFLPASQLAGSYSSPSSGVTPHPRKPFLTVSCPYHHQAGLGTAPPGFHGYLSVCVLLNLSEWAELLRGMCPLADGELFESRDQVSVTPVTVQGLAQCRRRCLCA